MNLVKEDVDENVETVSVPKKFKSCNCQGCIKLFVCMAPINQLMKTNSMDTLFLEKLTVTLSAKEFFTFHETQWFITMFTRSHHKSLF